MIRAVLIFAILCISLSCENEAPVQLTQTYYYPNQEITQVQLVGVSTNKRHFAINERIYFTLSNGSDSTLYVPTCARLISFYMQKLVKGNWVDTGANGFPCVGNSIPGMIVLTPRKFYSYIDAFSFHGTYRARYPVTFGYSGQTVWLYSNEFDVDPN